MARRRFEITVLGADTLTLAAILLALILIFLLLDLFLAGGGLTGALMSGMVQCGAAGLGSPYGRTVIIGLVLALLLLVGVFIR